MQLVYLPSRRKIFANSKIIEKHCNIFDEKDFFISVFKEGPSLKIRIISLETPPFPPYIITPLQL